MNSSRTLEFRKALSQSIDRDLINEIAYLGASGAAHDHRCGRVALLPEDIVNIYGEFDVEESNALLDGIGLPVGADGFRTFEDGTPIDLIIETQDTGTALGCD